jgi:hypothetical protein
MPKVAARNRKVLCAAAALPLVAHSLDTSSQAACACVCSAWRSVFQRLLAALSEDLSRGTEPRFPVAVVQSSAAERYLAVPLTTQYETVLRFHDLTKAHVRAGACQPNSATSRPYRRQGLCLRAPAAAAAQQGVGQPVLAPQQSRGVTCGSVGLRARVAPAAPTEPHSEAWARRCTWLGTITR